LALRRGRHRAAERFRYAPSRCAARVRKPTTEPSGKNYLRQSFLRQNYPQ